MAAEYLVRLDDACPTMDRQAWDAVLQLLSSRSVQPIIAIIPSNADPALKARPEDPEFWQTARSWVRAGFMIALHGYSHVLRPSAGGLVPVQKSSEFVGLPVEEQRRRISRGIHILETNGLVPEAWVAPAHGFDESTLQALRVESAIRVISDGFTRRAVRRDDFVWLPQQLWQPRGFRAGLWTICLHPQEMGRASVGALDQFLSSRPGAFPDPHDVVARAVVYGPSDALFEAGFRAALHARKLTGRIRMRRKT